MKIALHGTGSVAQVIAPKLVTAGHSVTLGSRDPGHPVPWAADPDSGIATASHAAAAAECELAIDALPGAVAADALGAVRAQLDGKVLLDIANAIVMADDGPALAYPNTSLAVELQSRLPGTRVVKAINTVSALVMADPGALSGPSNVFVSSDDAAAKALVTGLLRDLGWPADAIIDLGDLATARGPEHLFLLLVPLFAWASPRINLAVVR